MQNKILKSVSIVIVVTTLAKILGFVRDMYISPAFGTTSDGDTYFMALKLTTVIFMTFATAVSTALLPILNEHKAKKEDENVITSLNKVLTICLCASLVVMLALYIFAPQYVSLIAGGFEGEKFSKTVDLVRILIPSLIFIMLAYVLRTLFQAYEKFFIHSIISLPYNLLLIIYIVFFVDKYGVYGLATATLIGWVLQYAVQIPSLIKMKYIYKPSFKWKDDDVRRFLITVLPILISTLVYTANTLVDSGIASGLSDGKVSGLNYGYTIYSSIVTTIIVGISTVLFPKFIEMNVLETKDKLKDEIVNVTSAMLYVSMPLMMLLIVMSRPFVELAYMRGNFNELSVTLTQMSLIFYLVGTVGYSVNEILGKLFFAIGKPKIPMIVSIITVVLNIILDLLLVRVMDYTGLAFATSIAITTNAVILFIVLERVIGKLNKKALVLNFLKIATVLTVVSAGANSLMNTFYVTGGSIIINILLMFGVILLSGIIFMVLTYALKVTETKYVINKILNFGGKND